MKIYNSAVLSIKVCHVQLNLANLPGKSIKIAIIFLPDRNKRFDACK